ncbi:MAG: glycosyltransferase family 2 protein [Bacteroides sp.]|nr:glycosyltransferase family 2 protein [Tannerellaceae bacterium]MCD8181739.1 glycosyltransferase family 2 protein [Bacteroides sp.]
MFDLTVYVLTRNRSDLLIETLISIINQSNKNFCLVVSDNSTNNETKEILENYQYKHLINYIKRDGKLSGIEHLNLILSEVTTKYLMIFHDDDIMLPDMVEKLYTYLSTHSNLVAVACNAYMLKGDVFTLDKIVRVKDVLYDDVDKMVRNHMQRKNVPLFPSYMYNMDILKEEKLYYNRGQKYADAAFICSLLLIGKIFFISQPLFYYRIHSLQDSHSFDSKGYSQLYHYLIDISSFSKHDKDVTFFRLYNIYWNYVSNRNELSSYTFSRLLKLFLLKHNYILLLKLLIRKKN